MIEQPFNQLVAALAAKTPTPGGGAAAAMAACLGTSLFLMVIRFSRGKKATLEHDEHLARIETQLDAHLARLLPMAERDCAAFDQVSLAYKLPKTTDEEVAVRTRAIEEGMHGAMVVPEETLYLTRDVMQTMVAALEFVGRNIASDLGSGAELLVAAGQSAFYNVRINAAFLQNKKKAASALQVCERVRTELVEVHAAIKIAVDGLIS
jgi:formiminotetrahydrofolate cyclodeaminase